MADPTVAVIIPARDAAPTLPVTLASVAAQRRQPDEVVVIDDGSTDTTAAVATNHGATVVRETGRGAGAARNAGIAVTQCDVIAFLDADDCWSPDYLEEVVHAFRRPETTVSQAWVVDQTAEGVVVQRRSPPDRTPTALDIVCRGPLLTSATAVRRSAILNVGGFPEGVRRAEDAHLWARLLHAGAEVQALPSVTTYVVRREETQQASRQWADDHAWLIRDGLRDGWLDRSDAAVAWRAHHRLVAVRALAFGHRRLAVGEAIRALPEPAAVAVLIGAMLPARMVTAGRDARRAWRSRRRSPRP